MFCFVWFCLQSVVIFTLENVNGNFSKQGNCQKKKRFLESPQQDLEHIIRHFICLSSLYLDIGRYSFNMYSRYYVQQLILWVPHNTSQKLSIPFLYNGYQLLITVHSYKVDTGYFEYLISRFLYPRFNGLYDLMKCVFVSRWISWFCHLKNPSFAFLCGS